MGIGTDPDMGPDMALTLIPGAVPTPTATPARVPTRDRHPEERGGGAAGAGD